MLYAQGGAPHSPSRRVLIVLAIACACVTSAGAAGSRSPDQNLVGTTLRPVEDADALIGDLIDRLTRGGSRDQRPTIDRVLVTEDGPRRIAVTVSYTGLPNARLAGEIRGRDRRSPAQIQAGPVQLGAAAGQAALVFERPPDAADFESAYLRVIAIDPQQPSTPLLARLFALSKQWEAAGTASSTVVRIAPVPIGTTARLGPRPDYAAPPKIAVPVRGVTTVVQPAGSGTGGPAAVRDHRTAAATAGAGTVRDHRTTDASAAGGGLRVDPPPPGSPRPAQPQVIAMRRETAMRTAPATAMLPERAAVLQIDRFHYGIRPEDAQKGAQGPAAAPLELLEGLRTEDIDLNPAQLLSMDSSIYADKNPASGIFYYYPRGYHLEWAPDSGPGMRILYGAAAGTAASGDVLMAARLESGLDASEVQLATELLDAYKRRNPATVFTALRPLPLEKDGLEVSFGAVLGQYSIPKERIAITGLSDVLGEIDVSWVTDPVTKENLQLALTQDVGVNGAVSFAAAGGALEPQIPIAIQLADRDSYGRVRWNRTDGFRNLTPYPLRMRYLHALVIDPRNNLPILYSWSLGGTEVAPQALVQWDPAAVPAWIDTEAKRIWVDYAVVSSCEPCDKQVLDAITGGVTSVTADQITFHTITPLADVGGYELTAQVRSKYFDPKDRTLVQKSVVLGKDNQDFFLKPIYSGGAPSGQPLFEYLIELAMPDGKIYRGANWIPSDSLRVLIGKSQLEQSLGTLPGR